MAYDGGELYTMHRKHRADQVEWVSAIDAKTGNTLWEKSFPSAVPDDGKAFPGPNTTPLVAGDFLVSVGRNAVIRCQNRRDGALVWEHDLVAEFGANLPNWGYSSSPIAYRNMVIAMVGRLGAADGTPMPVGGLAPAPAHDDGPSLVAFDQQTGKLIWKNRSFRFQYSSPILINHGGRDQLITLPRGEVLSVDPANGEVLWSHRLAENANHSMTPVWNGEDLLFCSTAESGRVLKLTTKDGKTVANELWTNRKITSGINNPVRIGDLLVAPKHGQAPLILGVNIKTGKREWIKRGFGSTAMVTGDEKIILLDDHGQLALATATSDGLTLHSTWQIPEWSTETFTAPTLVGTTLYVRDRTRLMAFDLG